MQQDRYLLMVLMMGLLLVTTQAIADGPQKINYQGKLFDGGSPVDGTRSVGYKIYKGSSLAWTQSPQDVTVSNGLFSDVLDLSTGFESGHSIDSLFNSACSLEVYVGPEGSSFAGCTALSPKEALLATPHALNVADQTIKTSKLVAGAVIKSKIAWDDDATGDPDSVSAVDVPYDETGSGLSSENVKAALDELDGALTDDDLSDNILSDIGNVAISSVSSNEVLQWDGSNWGNATDDDNYADGSSYSGTGTKTLTITRTGILSDLTADFTDDDEPDDDSEVPNAITVDNSSSGTITLQQGTAPSASAEGRIQWDTDDDQLVIGDGGSTVTIGAGDDDNVVDDVDNTEITNGTVLNEDLSNSSITVNSGTGLSGGGSVSLGGSITLDNDLGSNDDYLPNNNATSNVDMNGNDIVNVGKVNCTKVDPIVQIDNQQYSTYCWEGIGIRTDYVGEGKLKNGEFRLDLSQMKKGSDLWLFFNTVAETTIVPIVTPQDPVHLMARIEEDVFIVKAISGVSSAKFSYRLSGKRVDMIDSPEKINKPKSKSDVFINIDKYDKNGGKK